MSVQPGLYLIQHVLNQDENLVSFASATREPESRIFGSVLLIPDLIQQWEVMPAEGKPNMYTISAPRIPGAQHVGFSVRDVDEGAPVFLSPEPKPLMIQFVESESRGPEPAFSVMFPVQSVGASFYMMQRPTKEANPPVILTAIPVIPDAPSAPVWIFRPILE